MRMKNKFLAAAFSLAVAFSLWLFVITVVSPESEKTYFDIDTSCDFLVKILLSN